MLRKLFFNLSYYQKPAWDTGISPPELLDFLRTHAPGRALDLGCGTGTNVITLARHGWQASGVDYARPAIRAARRKARQAGVQVDLRVGDVTRLGGLRGPFDLILDLGCFHSLGQPGKSAYRQNLERLLAPGGTFLLYGFFKPPAGGSFGLVDQDLTDLAQALRLVDRQDGFNRGGQPSAWLTYVRG